MKNKLKRKCMFLKPKTAVKPRHMSPEGDYSARLLHFFKHTFPNLLSHSFYAKYILFFIIFIISISLLCAEETQENIPSFQFEVSSETLTEGEVWILSLVVDHNRPQEVDVESPSFPAALFLDRFVKAPRFTDSGVRTVIEYSFIPNRAGVFRIEPFVITTPLGAVETNQIVVSVQAAPTETTTVRHRLVWETEPPLTSPITTGQRIVAALRRNNLSVHLPAAEHFMPEVSQNVILSALPASEDERARGIVIKFYIIPLEGNVQIPSRTIQFGNNEFEIPVLNIRVTENRVTIPDNIQTEIIEEKIEEENIYIFPEFHFNALDSSVFSGFWQEQYEEIYRIANDLWNNGQYAKALALLRHNERDHPAGVFLQPIRQNAEESLGIYNTANENRRRRILLVFLSCLILLIITVSPLIYFFTLKKPLWKKIIFVFCTLLITSIGSFWIYIFLEPSKILRAANSNYGVMTKTPVRRLADETGQEIFYLQEGQPVIILLNSGEWCYVRTNDTQNNSGWVPSKTIVFY